MYKGWDLNKPVDSVHGFINRIFIDLKAGVLCVWPCSISMLTHTFDKGRISKSFVGPKNYSTPPFLRLAI